MENKKKSNNYIKKTFLFLVSFFIVYMISTYFIERNKWLTDEQPYLKAKEELIKANMLMIPIKILHKLPFINEKSAILQPLLFWQDKYIKAWQDNLPNDDAEKYLGWYLFRLDSLIIPNLESVILYTGKFYSFEKVRKLLDKIWFDMEKLAKYKAKDPLFEEMRYIAFQKLSFLYASNFISYWNDEDRNFNDKEFKKDLQKMNNLLELHKSISKMQNYYKKFNNKIYKVGKNDRYDYARTHSLSFWILDFYNDTNKYKEFLNYCDRNKNIYLKDYLLSRNNLIDIFNNGDKSVDKILSDYTDNHLNEKCKNLNLKKGIKNYE